jgi:hypothetical protein
MFNSQVIVVTLLNMSGILEMALLLGIVINQVPLIRTIVRVIIL